MQKYTVRGEIMWQYDCDMFSPIPNAKVTVFFDDSNVGCTSYTNEKGEYSIEYAYSTYSHYFLGDVCGKEPNKITVIVIAEGFSDYRVTFKIKDVKKDIDGNGFYIPMIHRW